jgi:hypothetical protein
MWLCYLDSTCAFSYNKVNSGTSFVLVCGGADGLHRLYHNTAMHLKHKLCAPQVQGFQMLRPGTTFYANHMNLCALYEICGTLLTRLVRVGWAMLEVIAKLSICQFLNNFAIDPTPSQE